MAFDKYTSQISGNVILSNTYQTMTKISPERHCSHYEGQINVLFMIVPVSRTKACYLTFSKTFCKRNTIANLQFTRYSVTVVNSLPQNMKTPKAHAYLAVYPLCGNDRPNWKWKSRRCCPIFRKSLLSSRLHINQSLSKVFTWKTGCWDALFTRQ